MYQHDCQIRVRYSDTDQMGYVYYGNYAAFYEIGRVEALRNLGISYKELEDAGFMMPVLEVHSKYFFPARYDDLITLRTTIKELPKLKIKFEHEIFNNERDLLHKGQTILVFIQKHNHKPCRIPKQVNVLLTPFFNK